MEPLVLRKTEATLVSARQDKAETHTRLDATSMMESAKVNVMQTLTVQIIWPV